MGEPIASRSHSRGTGSELCTRFKEKQKKKNHRGLDSMGEKVSDTATKTVDAPKDGRKEGARDYVRAGEFKQAGCDISSLE